MATAAARRGGLAARQARELVAAVRTARRVYGAPPTGTLRRARRFRRTSGFTVPEALRVGLLDPAMPLPVADRYVSKDLVTRVAGGLNPAPLATLTEQKAVFSRYASARGLPVPRLYGVVGDGSGDAGGDGPLPVGPEAVARFLEGVPAEEMVVKPSGGYHGIGVRVLRRDGGALVDLSGARTEVARLAAELCADPVWGVFLVEERLRNHPELDALLPSEALQTLRVLTFVTDAGRPRVVFAGMRRARPGSDVDNFRGGQSGNSLVDIDLRTGTFLTPMAVRPDGCGLRPAAGPEAAVAGCAVPLWREAVALCERAALEFLPSRNLGWDVALTGSGPVIVEANRFYDARPTPLFGDAVRAVARAAATGGDVEGPRA